MLIRRAVALATLAVAAVGVLATSTTATAAASKCVALVLDFSHVGGSVSSACVTVSTSATGSDVLRASHHKVTFDPRYGDDFVCAIDGVPAGGCRATDNTHYWVYYHRAPGASTWHVSQEGAGTYRPANASTEGWVYDDGAASAPTPQNVPYRTICTQSPPAPTSSRTPAPTHSATMSASAPASRPAATGASPVHRASARPRPAASAVAPAPSPSQAASAPGADATASPLAAVAPHPHSSHAAVVAVLGGLVAAAGLGAAAVVRLRRSSG